MKISSALSRSLMLRMLSPPKGADCATLRAFPKNLPHFRFFQKGSADLLVSPKRLGLSSLRSSVVAGAPPKILIWPFFALRRATPARRVRPSRILEKMVQNQNFPFKNLALRAFSFLFVFCFLFFNARTLYSSLAPPLPLSSIYIIYIIINLTSYLGVA